MVRPVQITSAQGLPVASLYRPFPVLGTSGRQNVEDLSGVSRVRSLIDSFLIPGLLSGNDFLGPCSIEWAEGGCLDSFFPPPLDMKRERRVELSGPISA